MEYCVTYVQSSTLSVSTKRTIMDQMSSAAVKIVRTRMTLHRYSVPPKSGERMMFNLMILLFALFFVGCEVEVDRSYHFGAMAMEMFPDEVELITIEWQRTHGSSCDSSDLRVVWAEPSAVEFLCKSDPTTITGCFRAPNLIVFGDLGDKSESDHMTHELAHWLDYCANGSRGLLTHSDEIIWGDEGILERVRAGL